MTDEPSAHSGKSPGDGHQGNAWIHRLIELSSPEIDDLAASGAIVVLPISPLEEHGPHLPLGTDALLAEHFANLCTELIHEVQPSTHVVVAPLVPIGAHVFRFMGSISIRQRVIRNLLLDYGRSLSRAGFRQLIIVSSHGGPKHMVALDEAADALTRRHKLRTISLTSQIIFRFLNGELIDRISSECETPLSEDERTALKMDYHAGWWETAMMLMLHPGLVAGDYIHLADALVPRRNLRPKSPLKPPAGQGYLGAPARASVAFAHASMKVLREEARRIVEDFLTGTSNLKRFRSPLYRIPVLRTNFWYWLIAAVAAGLIIVRALSDILMR